MGGLQNATVVIETDRATVTHEHSGLEAKLVRRGDRWLIEDVSKYLSRFSPDPSDAAAGFREYSDVAECINQKIADGSIENREQEQEELRKELRDPSQREAAKQRERRRAGF